MHTTIKAHVAAVLGMFAIAASAQPATFGEGLKTPGYEDVVILDNATFHMVAGADDGEVAGQIAIAYRDAQLALIPAGGLLIPGERRSKTLTERVFAKHLPGIAKHPAEIKRPSRVDVQKMVIKRKQDVVNAKRFLLPLRLKPLGASSKGVNGEYRLLRDQLSRYVLRFETGLGSFGSGSYWHQEDGTRSVSFLLCKDAGAVVGVNLHNYRSLHGIKEACLGIPDFKDLNLPAGVFVSDLSKFGNLDEWQGRLHSEASTYTSVIAGIVVTPDGRSGTPKGRVGRNFAASELLIWDEVTMQVLAGPFSLKGKNPDVLYATNNCQKKLDGMAVVLQLPGNCEKLNPTLNPEFMFEVQP